MATLVVLAGRMIPTEEILKVSSRYLDWFRFYEFFFVKNPTNCPIIGLVPYIDLHQSYIFSQLAGDLTLYHQH